MSFITPRTDEVTVKVPRPLTGKELLQVTRPLTDEEIKTLNEYNAKMGRRKAGKAVQRQAVPAADLNRLARKFGKPEPERSKRDHPSNPAFNPMDVPVGGLEGNGVDWDKQKALHDQQRFAGKRKKEGGKKSNK